MDAKAISSGKSVGDTCEKWGYKFKWTNQHMSQESMKPLRSSYDNLGAAALERLQQIRESQATPYSGQDPEITRRPSKDLYTLLQDNYMNADILTQFWNETHTVPEWVDWEQLARGQEFFHRYIGANITGFALQGFVGENSASTGVVEVLVRTGGFSTKVLLHRLFETFQWLLQCTDSLPSIQPGGAGHASTIRVRLLHASVRQRILKLVATRPKYYDVDRFGVPVNTLDSIHSIATFCANPMWQQLPRQGIWPRQQEIEDYVALFRYLGYLLGTPPEYFDSACRAKAVMESMLYYELAPSETSKVVGYNFVECLRDVPPMNVSREFIEAGSRWMCGAEICDFLGLGRPGGYWYAVMAGQCFLSWGMCWAQRGVPALDRWVIKTSREQLKGFVIHGDVLKGPSKFDFKYVPREGKQTGAEDGIATSEHKRMTTSTDTKRPPKIDRWIERYYFHAFLLGCLILVAWVYVLSRVVIFAGAIAMRKLYPETK